MEKRGRKTLTRDVIAVQVLMLLIITVKKSSRWISKVFCFLEKTEMP